MIRIITHLYNIEKLALIRQFLTNKPKSISSHLSCWTHSGLQPFDARHCLHARTQRFTCPSLFCRRRSTPTRKANHETRSYFPKPTLGKKWVWRTSDSEVFLCGSRELILLDGMRGKFECLYRRDGNSPCFYHTDFSLGPCLRFLPSSSQLLLVASWFLSFSIGYRTSSVFHYPSLYSCLSVVFPLSMYREVGQSVSDHCHGATRRNSRTEPS